VIRILKEMGIDKTRVGYWRKVVVRAKDSKDRRDPGGIVADCWRKDVSEMFSEMFSSTSRKDIYRRRAHYFYA
jgi:hypothetical protein